MLPLRLPVWCRFVTACWYAFSRSVYAYQNGGRNGRLRNDPHICACQSTAVAEQITDDHNARLSLATRIVPGRRETTR